MADEFVLHSSMNIPETAFDINRKDYVWVTDSNNGSYSSGQIQLDLSTFANSNRYLNWKESHLVIPIVLTMSDDSTTIDTGVENNFALSLKNGVHNLINSMSLMLTNNEVISVQSFNNLLVNYKILTSFTPADEENLADTLLFSKDTAYSATFDSARGVVNNSLVATSQGIDTFLPGTTTLTYNKGRVRRMLNTSFNAGEGIGATSNFTTRALITGVGKSQVYEKTSSLITYHILATIPMRFLHDFFDKAPLMKNAYYRLVINTHLPTSATIAYTTAPAVGSTVSVNSPYGVCPFQISEVSSAGGLGFKKTTTASNITVRCGIVSAGTAATSFQGLTSCRLYGCLMEMSPQMERQYLSSPVRKVLYNDFLSFNTITGIASGATVNSLLTPSLSRLRTLYIFPFITKSANGTLAIAPMNSPWDSAPGTCSPFSYITNLNVQLSGINIFLENKSYRFQQFLEETRPKNSINGGLQMGLSSGLVNQMFYDSSYPVVTIDLSRHPQESDDIAKSVLVSFTNQASKAMDYICIIEYEKQLNLNVEVGAIVI